MKDVSKDPAETPRRSERGDAPEEKVAETGLLVDADTDAETGLFLDGDVPSEARACSSRS
jgi:hypothetical protein